MSLKKFDDLFKAADALPKPVGVAAAGGADVTVLQALEQAADRGWVMPIVTGNRTEIENAAGQVNVDLTKFDVVQSDEPAVAAVEAIHDKRAAMLMKGQLPTPALMKAVLNSETGLRSNRIICQMVLMEIPKDERVFLMTDTGITIQPTLSQKADLTMHAIETAECLGERVPKVAMMAATEKVNDAMPETLDAEAISQQAADGLFGDCSVQGPLSFDLAYAKDAGAKKNIDGEAVGATDAMVFPDLLSANLTVKGIMYTADCKFGGVLCGTSVPVVFMSRADDTETRLRSLAFALAVQGQD